MYIWKTIVLAVAIIPAICLAKVTVSIYEKRNKGGDKAGWPDSEGYSCHDFPKYLNDKVSYIDVTGGCIVAFQEKSCLGKSIKTDKSMALSKSTLNDLLSSWYVCAPNDDFCKTPIITVNTNNAPDLKDFEDDVKSALETWFPSVCRLHWSPSYKDVDNIEVIFVEKMSGIIGADVWGKKIYALASYFRDNKNSESLRKFVHEMAHIVQQYKSGCGWISEGLADLVAIDHYQYAGSKLIEKPGAGETYYTTQIYFLKYLQQQYSNLIYRINDDCRNGIYRPEVVEEEYGKNFDKFWEDMLKFKDLLL